MKNEPDGAEKLKELLQTVDAHPMVKAIKAEEAAKVLEARQAAAARIARATKTAGIVIPGLEVELSKAEEKLKKHDEERKGIIEEITAARVTLAEERHLVDWETKQAETVLLSN
jgi:hypothetical protein